MRPATESLAAALANVTGARLAGVQYGLLSADESQDVGSTAMQLGGEVALTFTNDHRMHFTWSGWPDASQDWVLRGTSNRLCRVSKCIDASSLGPWPSLVGRPLIEAQVLGWQDEPSVVRLRFDQGSVLVGVGSNGWFGSADSLLVRPDQSPFLDFPTPIGTLWRGSLLA